MNKTFTFKTKLALFIINIFILLSVLGIEYYFQHKTLKAQFEHDIENILKQEITNNISSIKGVINSLSSYYQSTIEMDSSVFSNLAHDLLDDYTYIEAIAFATVVKKEEKEKFESEMQDNGLYNFSIKVMNEHKVLKYAPIIYIEPSNFVYTKYYGLDFYNSIFKSAFEEASKIDKVTIKEHITIDKSNTGLLLFIKSTYKNINNLDTPEKRMDNTNGFYMIFVNYEKLFFDIRKKFKDYNILIIKNEDINKLPKEEIFNELRYLKKINSFENSSLSVTKVFTSGDFNLISFVLYFIVTILIQGLLLVIWYMNKSSKNKLNYKATHDDLTNLVNRTYFKEEFNQKAKEIQKNSKEFMSVLFIDIDRFKDINDSLGHKFGDQVLIEVSQRFQKIFKNNGVVCRHGGDEFLILIDKTTDTNLIVENVKGLMAEINKPIQLKTHNLFLTVSVGISLYPNDADNVDDLLKNADSAMYKAKDDGRNTYKFYHQNMTLEIVKKVTLLNELRSAILNDEFVLYYQPQYNGKNDKLVGLEVLVRWINKEGVLISPATFIPLAEETGLIVELDRLVMRKALSQLAQWREKELYKGSISLNLSMKQLKSADFVEVLKKELSLHKIDPKSIELEVTESAIMDNPVQTIAKLYDLHEFGIKLSIDDFGTGYSSLAYLKKLPINKLKIDKTFIDDIPYDDEDIAIVKSIIALAKSLKLEVIAEGVESLDQKNFLIENDCPIIQGYLYSKPLDTTNIEKVLS